MEWLLWNGLAFTNFYWEWHIKDDVALVKRVGHCVPVVGFFLKPVV